MLVNMSKIMKKLNISKAKLKNRSDLQKTIIINIRNQN